MGRNLWVIDKTMNATGCTIELNSALLTLSTYNPIVRLHGNQLCCPGHLTTLEWATVTVWTTTFLFSSLEYLSLDSVHKWDIESTILALFLTSGLVPAFSNTLVVSLCPFWTARWIGFCPFWEKWERKGESHVTSKHGYEVQCQICSTDILLRNGWVRQVATWH